MGSIYKTNCTVHMLAVSIWKPKCKKHYSSTMKYRSMNLRKYVQDLCAQNCKTLVKYVIFYIILNFI